MVIIVTIDGTTLDPITINSGSGGSDSFVVPAGASVLSVQYGSWDSEVTFQFHVTMKLSSLTGLARQLERIWYLVFA